MTLTNGTATDTGYFTCVRREKNIDYFETMASKTLSMLDPNRRKFTFLIRQNIMSEFEQASPQLFRILPHIPTSPFLSSDGLKK